MSFRLIYKGDDGLTHCVIGDIVEETNLSYVIEYPDTESILGHTNLKTIKKSDIADIVHR